MTKPQPPDLTHINLGEHMALWDHYADIALTALLSFHGSDGSASNSGAIHVAEIADAMVEARMARIGVAKEAMEAEKEAAKKKVAK